MKLKILFLLFSIQIAFTMNAQDKLIYVGDPMCSWCYGFAPQLEAVIEKHQSQMDIELVTGGLRPYFEKPISEMKDFLFQHWKDVNNATQQPFNYDILDRSDINYDTEPSCRAVVVVRSMNPEKEFEFFKMTQEAFYYDNKNLSAVESYDTILEDLALDKEIFKKRFNANEYKDMVKKDFKRASELGVNSFPSLLLQSGDEVITISTGYKTAEQLNFAIDKALKK